MTEYATRTQSSKAFLDPVFYFRLTAWDLTAVSLMGVLLVSFEAVPRSQYLSLDGAFLQFTWWHNALHVILAAACFLFGYASLQPSLVRTFAIVFGSVYLLLGVAGFFLFTDPASLALTPTLNIVHIALGGWALAAGLMARP